MTNFEKIRAMDARELARFISSIHGDPDIHFEFRAELCNRKTCKWNDTGFCEDENRGIVCWGAVCEWLEREIDKPGDYGLAGACFDGRSHRKLWEREKVTHCIKKGKSNLRRRYIYKRKFTVTVYVQKKIHSLLEEIKNKETDGTAIEHAKTAELPF